MKLLQCNIWGGRLEPQLLQLISEQDADIICLQEAIDIKGGRSALFASVEDIQKASGAAHVYMSPALTLNYMHRKADYGNCIISKYPILSSETVFTGKEYVTDYDSLEYSSDIRNIQQVVLALPEDKQLTVLNHHGHHVHEHKNGDDETMRQCQTIAEIIRSLKGPVIFAGDLNLSPSSESLQQINNLLTNLPVQYELETTRTSLTTKTEVCDYIFVSDDIAVNDFVALNDVVSDHKALVLDFN